MKGRKRSLSQTGGPVRAWGDPERARMLAEALAVDPDAALPFTHGFHAYPARMHPETARRAIEAFTPASIADPFVGSGTVAVEAVRRGARFVGCDVSPVALEVAWVRTRVLLPERCREVEQRALRLASKGRLEGNRSDPLPEWARGERAWYAPHTLREIVVLKEMIEREAPGVRRLLLGVLSSIVVKLSRQRSDSDVRPDPAFRPAPAGTTFRLFKEKASELTGMLLRLSSDLHKRGVPFVEPELRLADARTAELPAVDLVFTSPPYAGTYDYALHHARRYPILGFTSGFTEAGEIGARRAEAAGYREDLERALRIMLRAAPRALLLVGDGRMRRNAVRADRLVDQLARAIGARVVAVASQRRRDGSGGPPRNEHLILVERA